MLFRSLPFPVLARTLSTKATPAFPSLIITGGLDRCNKYSRNYQWSDTAISLGWMDGWREGRGMVLFNYLNQTGHNVDRFIGRHIYIFINTDL